MGKRQVKLQKHRYFSEVFRKSRVKEYESGQYTVRELSKLYSVSDVSVYRWIHQYSIYNKKGYKVVDEDKSARKKVTELKDQIAEAERIIGQKQINIDYLEELIELAKELYDIDLKKNFNTKHSKDSGKKTI
jgi:transposase